MLNAISAFSVRYLRADRILQYLPSVKANFGKMHSFPTVHKFDLVTVQLIPTLGDNYTYLVVDNVSNKSILIDPADGQLCKKILSENQDLDLSAILATHHHWDHVGGIADILTEYPNVPVYTSDSRVPETTHDISDVSQIEITERLKFDVLHTPCHTKTHVCYYHNADKLVFTGDTLFIAGCGRFFEGTPEEMDNALNKVLGSLPDETKVFCGHEYTLSNLKFAGSVEPDNEDILEFNKKCKECRKLDPPNPTIPSTILQEKKINPFMRLHNVQIKESVGAGGIEDNIEIMRLIRLKKDNFKG